MCITGYYLYMYNCAYIHHGNALEDLQNCLWRQYMAGDYGIYNNF